MFKGISSKQVLLEGESPTLNGFIVFSSVLMSVRDISHDLTVM